MNDKRVVFLGSKRVGLEILKSISKSVCAVFTFDDGDDGRSVFADFVSFCKQTKQVLKVVTRASAEAEILAQKPDVCVVCGWYWILKSDTLRKIPGGAVGVHHSLLPTYRGGAPVVWAMINGESQVGTTLFHFADGIDNGDMIDQRTTDIDGNDYVSDVLDRLERLDVEMVTRHLEEIRAGKAPRRSQDESRASYCGLRTPDDGQIDWSKDAQEVRNFVRAQSDPYPGAWTLVDGKRLILWKADVFPRPCFGRPGQVVQVLPEGIVVACGRGTALLVRVAGKASKRAPAADLIKSIRTRLG